MMVKFLSLRPFIDLLDIMAREATPILEVLDQKSEAQKQALIAVKERLDFHQSLIYAVLAVTAVGFVAVIVAVFDIFIQYKRFDSDKYNEFTKVLNQQNDRVTTEQSKNFQSQMDKMQGEIDNLWKNKYPVRR